MTDHYAEAGRYAVSLSPYGVLDTVTGLIAPFGSDAEGALRLMEEGYLTPGSLVWEETI